MDASNLDRLGAVMADRTLVYTLLARLFRKEVDEGLLETLKGGAVFETDDADLAAGLDLMRGYLASPEASTLDLARDYAKAFCGAGSTKRNSAYPFESVYTSENGMLMQEARDEVLKWYHRFGLSKSADWNDCEDHLGLELEFVAYLAGMCRDAAQRGDAARAEELAAAQRDFVRDHLANWLPEFDRDADHKARTGFYRGLARFTSRYVQEDLASLEGLLAPAAA